MSRTGYTTMTLIRKSCRPGGSAMSKIFDAPRRCGVPSQGRPSCDRVRRSCGQRPQQATQHATGVRCSYTRVWKPPQRKPVLRRCTHDQRERARCPSDVGTYPCRKDRSCCSSTKRHRDSRCARSWISVSGISESLEVAVAFPDSPCRVLARLPDPSRDAASFQDK